ncbi:hypothetical protein, partial [Pseudomonas syringae group genomosp. 3]|uniref:hypothetical protein n=1 Tax=Pseudomonas syringae group genomosp. 3 TaxID=251701 RepID=UPI001C7E9D8A
SLDQLIVPSRKPPCCLDGSIKPPFYETASASTTEGNNAPKIGAINSFCKSKFANPHHLTGKANSNHALRWFRFHCSPPPAILEKITTLLSHTERPRQVLRCFRFRYTLDPYVHKFIFEFFNEFRKKAFMNSL